MAQKDKVKELVFTYHIVNIKLFPSPFFFHCFYKFTYHIVNIKPFLTLLSLFSNSSFTYHVVNIKLIIMAIVGLLNP